MNKISTYRKQLGLSQRQLATHLGWIQSRLANYEANFRTPGLEECRKIVATLNHLGSRCVLDDVFPSHVNDSRTILAKVNNHDHP
ncbi:helix-turn-helix transcriptional regulator [Salmonella enterica]|nr:helix-turn-helix transcriptional regulator [Salmonella enterica]